MTLTDLLPKDWRPWPKEALPPGVELAAFHSRNQLYVFRYADGSTSVFHGVRGHRAGFGADNSDETIAACLAVLARQEVAS